MNEVSMMVNFYSHKIMQLGKKPILETGGSSDYNRFQVIVPAIKV